MNLAGSPEGNATERSQGLCFVHARVCVIGSPSGHNLESAGFDASDGWGWRVGVEGGLTLAADFSEALIRVVRVLLKHTATNLCHCL